MTEPTTVEVLREARARIATPDHWTQGALALDADRMPVGVDHPTACRWCAVGAYEATVVKVAKNARRELLTQSVYAALANAARARKGVGSVAAVNDCPDTTHGDILAIYDRAIATAEKREVAA